MGDLSPAPAGVGSSGGGGEQTSSSNHSSRSGSREGDSKRKFEDFDSYTKLLENATAGDEGVFMIRPTAMMLQALAYQCTPSALQMFAILGEEYFLHLLSRLHSIAMIQRRNLPSVHDLAFLMTEEGIHTSDLEDEYMRSQFIFQPQLPSDEANETAGTLQSGEGDSPSLQEIDSWNKRQQELSLLAPTTRKKEELEYIPSWMPPLPADYTYRTTPTYPARTTNPKDIREKIIEEGRVVEQALRKLGAMSRGSDGATQSGQLSLLGDADEQYGAMNRSNSANEKMFDIVAMAASRRKKAINPIILHLGKKGKA
ncbi:transcription factor TFIID complex subunit 8 C-term-domain-containing protein [Myxozyma melibiosi]|uniref:Transcription initiation factor TFIID subunit 8 n=1 Tax=Myxozyma melibiosi TaxID=54550 RepID=A0ABR1FBF3_9ASCO